MRAVVALAVATAYAVAIASAASPAATAIGLAPLAWLALEGGWRLLDR